MTTASWSTVVDQSTDAAFRTWGSELNAKFALVGMVQTADTGQINWTTVTRAAANTAAGYEIWKLSSGNLYFKIEYGSGNVNTVPSLWITVGTGSNGSGTLTGQLSTRSQAGLTTTAITSTTTNYQSYLCATANYFGLSWKISSANVTGKARVFMSAMQTVDTTGAATTVGYFVLFTSTPAPPIAQCVATTAGVVGTQAGSGNVPNFCIIPGNYSATPPSSTDGSGNNQAFLWWYCILGTAAVQPLLHAATILNADLTLGNTASMTLVGSTAHTYIAATNNYQTEATQTIGQASQAIIMVWE